MVVLDTSALVRFFTQDIKSKAKQVKLLIETEKIILIPEVVFPELEYVLSGQYGQQKIILLEGFNFLINKKNIKTTLYVKKAIEIYEKTNLDIADCLILVRSIKGRLASFDREMLKIKGVNKYWK